MKSLLLAKSLGSLALFGLIGMQTASASLVLQTFQQLSGTGLGTVPTIVTFQANGTETGCVGLNGTTGSALIPMGSAGAGGCTAGGDTKPGGVQAKLVPLSASGVTSAANFGLIFNAVEPAGDSLAVTNITAAFYNSTGTSLLYETSGLFCQNTAGGALVAAGTAGCLLNPTGTGTGNSGFLVTLNSAQQLAATTAGVFLNTSNLVGVSSSAGTTAAPSAGGSETIFLTNATVSAGGQVPEPTTYGMLGVGLCALAYARKFLKA